MKISFYIIPVVVAAIVAYGLIKKVDVFSEFIIGAKKGLLVVYQILPSLVALVVSVGMLKSSGVLDLITFAIAPISDFLGIPSQVVPLALIRPISGSGALAIFEQTLSANPPDSYIGRIASVMQGSTETTFYTIAVYFGACKIEKIKYTLFCALVADLVGFVMSVIAVNIFFR